MTRFLALLLAAAALHGQSTFNAPLPLITPSSDRSLVWALGRHTVYRSDDGGRLLRGFIPDPTEALSLTQLHVDSGNPSLLYLLTSSPQKRFWRSLDGGRTWALSGAGLPADAASTQILQSPSTPSSLYVRIGIRLYKSLDQGQTFQLQATLPGSTSLFIAPSNPRVLYCSTEGITSGLSVSEDEGQTWRLAAPLPQGNIAATIVSASATLVIHPRNPNQIFGHFFLRVREPSAIDPTVATAMYRSNDAGRTWIPSPTQAGFLSSLSTSSDGSLLLISGSASFRSTDFGQTLIPLPSVAESWFIHQADPTLVLTSTGRVSTDGAASFTSLNRRRINPLAPLPDRQITLESGTAVHLSGSILDSEGETLSPESIEASSTVPWLKMDNSRGRSALNFETNAVSLLAGDHEGALTFRSSQLPTPLTQRIRLTVRDRIDPRLRLRVRLLANTREPIQDLALDQGLVYLATELRILRLNASGQMETLAGSTEGSGGAGDNGAATQGRFRYLSSLAMSRIGILTVDNGDQRIRRFPPGGIISTFFQRSATSLPRFLSFDAKIRVAANGAFFLSSDFSWYRSDGGAFVSVHPQSSGLLSLIDFQQRPDGTWLGAERGRLLRLTPGQSPTTIGGNGELSFAGDHGPVAQARLNDIVAVATGSSGISFLAEARRIRAVFTDGTIQTVAGNGEGGFRLRDGDLATAAPIGDISALASDNQGRLYVGTTTGQLLLLEALSASTPQIAPGGIVSLASGARRIAPGAIFSIYGTELASATASNSSVPLPTRLNGVQVLVNGAPVPLFFVSPGQINAQMPFTLNPGPTRITVLRDGTPGTEQTVEISPAQPDILTYGAGRAVAVNPDGSINSPDRGIRPGEVLVVYLTGIGRVDTPLAAGALSPSSPLARPVVAHTARLGSQPATLLFLGLAPGFVGLAQANLIVPPGLPPGDAELLIEAGSAQSNAARVHIARPD